ncbi:MAG: RNA polymerase subunit sigma-70 [Proteobacteria bacterium]|nr:RNA polymerase subunit sigma-70 [Pseudomonadota bacterium]
MKRKIPQTFEETIAECDRALSLGITNTEDLYKPLAIALNGHEFLSKKLPKRELIISPCLPKQGLAMIFAKRGVGKTYFSLLLACKIASGRDVFKNRWKVNKEWKLLYIDGEMPASDMQERLKTLISEDTKKENLSIITRDLQKNGIMPNISSQEGQEALEPHIQKADVIIIDNLSTLAMCGKENEATSWDPIAQWALRLRSIGKTIIFIHHAGKDNNQRGTSKKEDILDTVINLRHPSNYSSEEGARFEVHFEKSRGFAGEEAKAFEVKLEIKNDKALWQTNEIEDLELERVVELSHDGLSQRDIVNETGISLSKVNRILKRRKKELNKT